MSNKRLEAAREAALEVMLAIGEDRPPRLPPNRDGVVSLQWVAAELAAATKLESDPVRKFVRMYGAAMRGQTDEWSSESLLTAYNNAAKALDIEQLGLEAEVEL
jgi:hypothetical protein